MIFGHHVRAADTVAPTDGLRHGRDILALLRQGPPWPTLGELGSA